MAEQKERVIEALKIAEKKDLDIAAIISERENEKLAFQQEKSKIENFVQNINKLEQEILKEKENTKEAVRETEKKTQEIINYFKVCLIFLLIIIYYHSFIFIILIII